MKFSTAILIVTGLVCSVGCDKKDPGPTAARSTPRAGSGTEILVRAHFVGAETLAGTTNAARFREVWGLPETRRLVEQTLNRLAHAPRTLHADAVGAAEDERGAALLRPMLNDLLANESFLQVRGPADRRGEWTLLARLPADRVKAWHTGLAELMQVWKLGAVVTNAVEGFPAWEVKRAEAPALVRCVQAGSWLALGVGPEGLATVAEAAQRIRTGGRPIPAAADAWLELELNLPQLAGFFGFPADLPWPRARCSIVGAGENLKSTGRLTFSGRAGGTLEPWRVPTNIVTDPLISFTAMRGTAPWLAHCRLLDQLGLKPPPNQVYVWGQSHMPFQTFVAFPAPDATNQLMRAADRVPPLLGTNWQARGLAQVSWQTNGSELLWKGLPYLTPFLKPIAFQGGEWVFGGLFPPAPQRHPMPVELLRRLDEQPRLVYYDWEITDSRLFQLRATAQLIGLIANQPQLGTNAPAMAWLIAAGPKLGNTITEVTADSPAEWSFVRKAPLGLSAAELVALARWLESVHFPAPGFELPPHRPPAAGAPPANRNPIPPSPTKPGK